jgi:hypothetical protein
VWKIAPAEPIAEGKHRQLRTPAFTTNPREIRGPRARLLRWCSARFLQWCGELLNRLPRLSVQAVWRPGRIARAAGLVKDRVGITGAGVSHAAYEAPPVNVLEALRVCDRSKEALRV